MNEHAARLYHMIGQRSFPEYKWESCDIPIGHHLAIQGAADHIEAQAAEIERHREAKAESIGLAGERMGTIAALRHQLAHAEEAFDAQAKRIEELEKTAQFHLDGYLGRDEFVRQQMKERDDAIAELTRLREMVEKRGCEVCALADMTDGRFGLGWWTSEAKAIRVTFAAQAATAKGDDDLDELTEWPCQQLMGGTGAAIYVNTAGMCKHPECHPKNDDRSREGRE